MSPRPWNSMTSCLLSKFLASQSPLRCGPRKCSASCLLPCFTCHNPISKRPPFRYMTGHLYAPFRDMDIEIPSFTNLVVTCIWCVFSGASFLICSAGQNSRIFTRSDKDGVFENSGLKLTKQHDSTDERQQNKSRETTPPYVTAGVVKE